MSFEVRGEVSLPASNRYDFWLAPAANKPSLAVSQKSNPLTSVPAGRTQYLSGEFTFGVGRVECETNAILHRTALGGAFIVLRTL